MKTCSLTEDQIEKIISEKDHISKEKIKAFNVKFDYEGHNEHFNVWGFEGGGKSIYLQTLGSEGSNRVAFMRDNAEPVFALKKNMVNVIFTDSLFCYYYFDEKRFEDEMERIIKNHKKHVKKTVILKIDNHLHSSMKCIYDALDYKPYEYEHRFYRYDLSEFIKNFFYREILSYYLLTSLLKKYEIEYTEYNPIHKFKPNEVITPRDLVPGDWEGVLLEKEIRKLNKEYDVDFILDFILRKTEEWNDPLPVTINLNELRLIEKEMINEFKTKYERKYLS